MNNFQKVVQLNESFGNESVGWDYRRLSKQFSLIREEFDESNKAMHQEDRLGLVDGLGDLLVVTYGMFHLLGVNADDVMERISQANFSKLINNEDEAKASLAHYQNLNVSVGLKGNYPKAFVVVEKDCYDTNGKYYPKGKFLKNINWKEPNYEGLEGV